MNSLQFENVMKSISHQESQIGVAVPNEKQVLREMENQGMQVGHSSESMSFGSFLQNQMNQVNAQQQQSDVAIRELISGRSKNIHETMLTIEKADTSLKLMMQVRNKILDAYKEIMRMQV